MSKKEFRHPLVELLNGDEPFIENGDEKDFSVSDFWRYMYSNIYDNTGDIAEFIVAMALGINHSYKKYGWTLYDIDYKNLRIEVKATQYYQIWEKNGKISKQRRFGIGMAHSIEGDKESPLVRNNDVYVFCLNKGTTFATSNPLVVDNWRFWVIPTTIINKVCRSQKTINLHKVKSLSETEEGIPFHKLRETIEKYAR